jgi:two-component system phosphate regulon response regulator PhoB
VNDTSDTIDVLEHLGVQLDRQQQTVICAGQTVNLTPTEFRLLETVLGSPGQTFSRAELMAAVIAGGAVVLERTIDVHICSLRQKLAGADVIETVRGRGYRFRK